MSRDGADQTIRRRAYQLWERAGCSEWRSEEFCHTARTEIEGGESSDAVLFDPFEPSVDEPPEIAFQHGVPVGMLGERVAERGVLGRRPAH